MFFEPGSLNLRSWLNLHLGVLMSSVLTQVEFRSVLERRIRAGELTSSDRAPALSLFEANTRSVAWLEVDADVRFGAELLLTRSATRTLDALHLPSALLMAHRSPGPRTSVLFIGSDHGLIRAAAAEGLNTWNPATSPAPIL